MKLAIVFLGIIGLTCSAPQPRKLFHEHVEDFLDIILEEVGEQLEELTEEYIKYEEFLTSIDYILTNNFKDLVYEMESLPEFQAVIDYLENDDIDIHYFLDRINEFLEDTTPRSRVQTSGKDMTAYINDCISIFPKSKLAALFDQKIAEDEEFRVAIENLESDEFKQTFNVLWESETFRAEVDALHENGIHVESLLDEIIAIFGQN